MALHDDLHNVKVTTMSIINVTKSFIIAEMEQPSGEIKWAEHDFHPVVPSFPARGEVSVLDLTGKLSVSIEDQMQTPPYSIGKYDENRNIYNTELFSDGRSLHVGLGKNEPSLNTRSMFQMC